MLVKARPTLKGLMVVIALIGVGTGAMIRPNKFWALVLPVFLLTMLLTAILGFLIRRGPKRAYWVGFALFGWAYLVPILYWQDETVNDSMSINAMIRRPIFGFIEIVAV